MMVSTRRYSSRWRGTRGIVNNMAVKLGDICNKIGSGFTPTGGSNVYVDSGVALVRSQNVLNMAFSTDGLAFINESIASAMDNVSLCENDILLNITGDSVARVCLVPKEILPARVNQHVCIIRVDDKKANPRFVYYQLYRFQNNLLSLASVGATRKALTKQMIEDLEIELPVRQLQDNIVEMMSIIQSKIDVNKAINDNLLEIAKALFKDSLDKGNTSLTIVSEICSSVTDGVHNTVEDDPEGPALLLSCKNIKDGQLTIGNNERTISRQTFDKLRKRTKLAIGDILLTSVGTIGETYLIIDEPDNIEFQRSVALIKPDQEKVSSEYLYLAINYVKESIINAAHGAVQQCLFINDVCSIEVPLIDKVSIEKLTNAVRPLFSQINLNRKESQHLVTIRDYLLPKLMSGELDVSDIAI